MGEEALSEDKAQALTGAGHDVMPAWRRLKWPYRGVKKAVSLAPAPISTCICLTLKKASGNSKLFGPPET